MNARAIVNVIEMAQSMGASKAMVTGMFADANGKELAETTVEMIVNADGEIKANIDSLWVAVTMNPRTDYTITIE
jgi:hypothetical protein